LATARDFIEQFGGEFPDGGEAAHPLTQAGSRDRTN
jgi:hypothetical protein